MKNINSFVYSIYRAIRIICEIIVRLGANIITFESSKGQSAKRWKTNAPRTFESIYELDELISSQREFFPILGKTSVNPPIVPSFSIVPRTLTNPAINFSFWAPYWIGDVNGDGKDNFGAPLSDRHIYL